jgi:hypothetical protein
VLFCAVSRRRDSILSARPGNTGLPRRIASRVVFWLRISLAWAATPRPLHTPPHARSHRQARTTLDGSTVPSICDCVRRKHPLLHSPSSLQPSASTRNRPCLSSSTALPEHTPLPRGDDVRPSAPRLESALRPVSLRHPLHLRICHSLTLSVADRLDCISTCRPQRPPC